MKRIAILLAAVFVASPVSAKTKYEPLQTRAPMIEVGQGGTVTQKHGIDYWTSGQPPRRFLVLGVITDTRGTRMTDGDAIGSKSIAKMITKAGGDAVIILSQGTRTKGVISGGQASAYGNNAFGSGWSQAIGETRTALAVVRYLPDDLTPSP